MPFGAAFMKKGRIEMQFPTEQEAYEYKKDLEEERDENRTEPRSECGKRDEKK